MAAKVLAAKDRPAPSPPRAKTARAPSKVRDTGQVQVSVDPALGTHGQQLAATVADQIGAAYADVLGYFGATSGPTAVCQIDQLSSGSDGTGGAWHTSCSDTTEHCDADFSDPTRTLALFVAEFSESMMAVQNKQWDCGNTNGEALSRFHAEVYAPGALDDYSSVSSWLDTPDRPDWLHQNQGTDTDYPSIGCGVLFLFWLLSRGHSVQEITAAGGPLLGDTWYRLGENGDPYTAFRAEVDKRWPLGSLSGVMTDNPWPATGGGGGGGGEGGGNGGGGGVGPLTLPLTLTLNADGTWTLAQGQGTLSPNLIHRLTSVLSDLKGAVGTALAAKKGG